MLGTNAYGQGLDDTFRYSQNNYSMATARSSAMGGAFVSLGSDPISMSMNPAGLGMYRSSEVSITPAMRLTNSESRYNGGEAMNSHRNKFYVGNFAAIINGRNLTGGIGYNRLADFAGSRTSMGISSGVSMLDVYAAQLTDARVASSNIGSPDRDPYQAFYKYGTNLWPAILAYQTYLVDPTTSGGSIYTSAPTLFAGDRVTPVQKIRTNGSVDEITISGAYNYNDFIYAGVTLGVQSINYAESQLYGEFADLSNQGSLDEYSHRQFYSASGTGVNLKLGLTIRPQDWLRIGVAYHTPTWTNVTTSLDQDMTVAMLNSSTTVSADTPQLLADYSMDTPSRLLVGASAVLARKVILSFDYERVWYGAIKYKSNNMMDLNGDIESYLGAANNFRVGAEVAVTPSFFIRAGYALYGSVYKNSDWKDLDRLNQYSGGIGYRSRMFSIDLAYVYGDWTKPDYKYFSYGDLQSGNVSTKIKTSNILMTLAFRF